MNRDIFDIERLPPAVDSFLRETNPWWAGKPGRVLPEYRRQAFDVLKKKLASGLAPIVVLRGPRRVGKSVLQEQFIHDLRNAETVEGNRILRVQFDEIPSLKKLQDPVLSLCRWFESRVLGKTFNESAAEGKPAYIMLDEVQNLRDWAPQLKSLVDHHSVKVMVTGSSSLRIEAGRDSLAGRIASIDLGTLLLREIAALRFACDIPSLLGTNGLQPLLTPEFWRELNNIGSKYRSGRDLAFQAFAERGGYPDAQAQPDIAWEEMADHLNETVVKRAIQHDLRMGSRGQKRDQNLLEEIFRLVCRYAGQAPGPSVFVQEIRQALQGNIGYARILNYLKFLDGALLLRLVAPLELRLKRRKGNLKLCLCDHGLRASWLQEKVPLSPVALQGHPEFADLAGHLAESIVGYFLCGLPHLDLAHFPERAIEPEVDFVLTVGEHRIPMEIKYRQRIDPNRDCLGLKAFIEKTVYKAPFGILVTMHDGVQIPDPRIIPVSLPSLLLMR